MKRFLLLALLSVVVVGVAKVESASAWERGTRRAATMSPNECWHGPYYHIAWGMPLALVVPPNAERQVHWGWGIGNTRITPIWPQYSLGYPAPGQFGPAAIRPTPRWPSDLDQFGVYYIRGPW